MEDETNKRMKNQIVCRTMFTDLFKAVDLPRRILQIAAIDGDVIFLNMRRPRFAYPRLAYPRLAHPRRPRDTVGKFSFQTATKLLVGFLIFVSEILYILIDNEHMNPERRIIFILYVVCGFLMYFLNLDLHLRIQWALPQAEWRRACINVGRFQENVMILMLVSMLYWILPEPILTVMPTPT